ncbi:putative disease resistance rpp8-like protein 2, partial [Quercus suber]
PRRVGQIHFGKVVRRIFTRRLNIKNDLDLLERTMEAYSIKIKEETGVVGLDEDIQAVVSELISENKHVVCIVGMKGTGKTTQAKKIFDHSAIVGHFTARDWVTPTDQKAKQVWINKVCDILKKEKYLAVLDDFTAENEIKMPGKL